MQTDADQVPLLLLRVPEAARALGIGRSMTYELISAGEIEVIHVGAVMRVPVDELTRFIERQRGQAPLAEKAVSSEQRSHPTRQRRIADDAGPNPTGQQLGLPL